MQAIGARAGRTHLNRWIHSSRIENFSELLQLFIM